jgi:two-component system, NarL family, invasion response regulator UvrY
MIKVLIADDHAILRRGLKDILERELQGAVCKEARNAQEVLCQVQKHDWGLVILDVSMPGRTGLDILGDLKKLRPKLPVLFLSVHPEDQLGRRVLKAGASGYLNKESAPEELIKAVRKVLAGGRYVSAALAEKLALDLSTKTEQPLHESLSAREFEVLRMIGLGKTISQIAKELHLSVTTVSTYRARILEKMNMTTTAELIHYAVANQISKGAAEWRAVQPPCQISSV